MHLSAIINAITLIAQRRRDVAHIKSLYPDHFPMYIRYKGEITRHIVPGDKPYSYLMFAIRRTRVISAKVGIIALVETPEHTSKAPMGNDLICDVAKRMCHPDGFMYIDVVEENVFG